MENGGKLSEGDFFIFSLPKIQDHTYVQTSSLIKCKISEEHSKHAEFRI